MFTDHFWENKTLRVAVIIFVLLLTACQPSVSRLAEHGDVSGLVEILTHEEEPALRVEAAQALGNLGDPGAALALINCLSEEDEDLRLAAVEALGVLGDPQGVQPLISALKDESLDVQDAAETALLSYGDAAVPALIEALKSIYPNFRARLIGILSQASRFAAPALVQALSSPVENVRLGAKEALINMGEPAIPYLTGALTEEDEDVNEAIMLVLKSNGAEAVPALTGSLGHTNQEVRDQAFDALVEIGEPAVRYLVGALDEAQKRKPVSDVLMVIGEPCVGSLIGALENPELEEPAGDLLIEMGVDAVEGLVQAYEADPDDFEHLLRPLAHGLKLPNAMTREKVKQAVVAIGEPAIPQLLALVKAANRVEFDGQVIYANPVIDAPFGQAEGELASGGLCDAAGNWNDKIVLCERGEITFLEKILNVQESGGVGVVHYNSASAPMLPVVFDTENEVRIPSVAVTEDDGLTLIRESSGEDIRVFTEDLSTVLEAAVAIGEPGIPQMVTALRQATLYYFAEEVLIAIGEPAIDPLITALEDQDAAFRTRVVYTLGRIGGRAAEEAIIEQLSDANADVRWEAAFALGELGSADAIDPLIDLLEDPDDSAAWASQDALIKIGIPAAEALLDNYHDESSATTGSAESALREIFTAHAQEVLEVALSVCRGEPYEDAAEYQRYESDFHPMVIVTSYDEISYMTDELPVDWLAFTPEQLELVVCLGGQEKEVVQVCRYYYTGTGAAAPSTTRYRYKETVTIFNAQTGSQIGARTFRGANPDQCPYQKTGSLAEITGDFIKGSEIMDWLATYGIPFED